VSAVLKRKAAGASAAPLAAQPRCARGKGTHRAHGGLCSLLGVAEHRPAGRHVQKRRGPRPAVLPRKLAGRQRRQRQRQTVRAAGSSPATRGGASQQPLRQARSSSQRCLHQVVQTRKRRRRRHALQRTLRHRAGRRANHARQAADADLSPAAAAGGSSCPRHGRSPGERARAAAKRATHSVIPRVMMPQSERTAARFCACAERFPKGGP
jgi:hypothetical protein